MDGQVGLVFDFRFVCSNNYEFGVKWQVMKWLEFDVVLFCVDICNELVVVSNINGCVIYCNVGCICCEGVELLVIGELVMGWCLSVGVIYLCVCFCDGFFVCIGLLCIVLVILVVVGLCLLGVLDDYGLLWLEYGDGLGWCEGIMFIGVGLVVVNDFDIDCVVGYVLVDVDVGYIFVLGEVIWFDFSVCIGNLVDCCYVGLVIVNDGNGCYFELGFGCNVMFGVWLSF